MRTSHNHYLTLACEVCDALVCDECNLTSNGSNLRTEIGKRVSFKSLELAAIKEPKEV